MYFAISMCQSVWFVNYDYEKSVSLMFEQNSGYTQFVNQLCIISSKQGLHILLTT